MSSKRESVRMPGRLQGMGHDIACIVFAEKVSSPGTDLYVYDRPFISSAPQRLQNGLYTVTFDGRVFSAKLRGGDWAFAAAI